MGNKNCRGNRAIARPSTEYFRQLKLKEEEEEKAKAALIATPAPEIDLSLLPNHPALIIFDNKSIGIHIDQCKGMKEQPTNMDTLIETISAYAPYVTSIDINIHAPFPHRESMDVQKRRTQCFAKLFVEINKFKLVSLHLCMLLDENKFPQMKLAAGIMGLSFKGWTLMYEALGVFQFFPVRRGSEFDLRLRGVFKKEVIMA
ncbi:hypothetical protein DID88_006692 [Monilinia fructigena]|uniref:Uncharacterized protein n=1 Tax=Monilinia fructigena TaxID=38457 RepID=A0A395IG24_9HELO|nr:hypothetical protein DID88_006692 [Monilinia fructigena]